MLSWKAIDNSTRVYGGGLRCRDCTIARPNNDYDAEEYWLGCRSDGTVRYAESKLWIGNIALEQLNSRPFQLHLKFVCKSVVDPSGDAMGHPTERVASRRQEP
jgi:hypothetical protein